MARVLAGMATAWFLALGVGAATLPAHATEQIPDAIIIDGSAPRDLLTYDFMMTPLFEAFRFPDLAKRFKELRGGSYCTALYRGYRATWEIRDATLYLVGVRMANCGRDPVPLTAFFPDSTGPVVASW